MKRTLFATRLGNGSRRTFIWLYLRRPVEQAVDFSSVRQFSLPYASPSGLKSEQSAN
jgi:hypothetical protein